MSKLENREEPRIGVYNYYLFSLEKLPPPLEKKYLKDVLGEFCAQIICGNYGLDKVKYLILLLSISEALMLICIVTLHGKGPYDIFQTYLNTEAVFLLTISWN